MVMQGLLPNYIKVVPSIAIAFVTYEQVSCIPISGIPMPSGALQSACLSIGAT